MEEKTQQEENGSDLCRCPHCPCCFCNETDLKKHIDRYGTSKTEHMAEFRRIHDRMEHGSFGGPE